MQKWENYSKEGLLLQDHAQTFALQHLSVSAHIIVYRHTKAILQVTITVNM